MCVTPWELYAHHTHGHTLSFDLVTQVRYTYMRTYTYSNGTSRMRPHIGPVNAVSIVTQCSQSDTEFVWGKFSIVRTLPALPFTKSASITQMYSEFLGLKIMVLSL